MEISLCLKVLRGHVETEKNRIDGREGNFVEWVEEMMRIRLPNDLEHTVGSVRPHFDEPKGIGAGIISRSTGIGQFASGAPGAAAGEGLGLLFHSLSILALILIIFIDYYVINILRCFWL